MKALLVRVGIDSRYGKWNAPVNPSTGEFVYVPIPENGEIYSGYEKSYEQFKVPCKEFGEDVPEKLFDYKSAHLDPDFSNLTYGDVGKRGKRVQELEENDVIAFYAGLRSTGHERNLIYSLIGLYVVDTVRMAKSISEKDWDKNAHTRKMPSDTDVIVYAKHGKSGRLKRCIPIGEYRNKAYRVKTNILDEWGGLGVNDGFIQRSGTLPWFLNPEKFYKWFISKNVQLIASNN